MRVSAGVIPVERKLDGSPEELLAGLTVTTVPSAFPAVARETAARHLRDGLGVALAAAAHPAGQIMTEVVAELGGAPQARVVGTAVATSMVNAAWANGTLAHLLDFDDTGFSHPTACILPAALAAAEHADASGSELLEALIVGYEVFERLAASGRPTESPMKVRGVHPTSLYGAPAAAAAAARLLGLDCRQVVVALGLAATDASGLVQQFGSWGKGLHAGNAARTGVQSALLARAGYEGDEQGISGDHGLFSVFHDVGIQAFAWMNGDLGSRWSIVDPGLSIKPYPTCASTLRAVDAMITIASEPGYDPADVERIEVHINPDLLHTLRFRSPTKGFQGKFSLDFTVACAALDGRLTQASFGDEQAQRPALRAMLERVEIRAHPEWVAARRVTTPLTVTYTTGQSRDEPGETHRGMRARPLTARELRDKYVTCARERLTADQAERSADALADAGTATSVRRIVDLVVPA